MANLSKKLFVASLRKRTKTRTKNCDSKPSTTWRHLIKKNLFHRGCYVDQWKGAGVSRFSTQNRDSMGSWDNPLVLLLPIALLAQYCWWHYIDTLLLLLLLPKTLHTEYKVFATTKSLSYYCRRYRCIYYHNSLPLLRRVFVCLFFVKK